MSAILRTRKSPVHIQLTFRTPVNAARPVPVIREFGVPRFAIAFVSSSGRELVETSPPRVNITGCQEISLSLPLAELERYAGGLTGGLCAPRPVFVSAGATNGMDGCGSACSWR